MFDNLGDKLQNALKKLTGKGKINEKDIKEVMREVKLSLLEADVNFKVVKDFIKVVSEKAVGKEVLESLTPGQQVVKIVRDELTELMGSTSAKLTFNTNGITIYMMVGLQGAGKTTNSAKLAAKLREKGKSPMLVALDVYRPAARDQLKVVGKQLDIPVFSVDDSNDPVKIAEMAIDEAHRISRDVLILDTAGRLHLDDVLMEELENIKAKTKPTEILLVVDAMAGQDSVNVAKSFHDKLGIDGIIMTKLDGDTRGGSALSMKKVTGAPIKFSGIGEKISSSALEEFHPDRMASRILGMGDMLTLIDKAQKAFDEKKAKELEEKIKKDGIDFNDFLDQINQMKSMGSLSDIISMIPGVNKKALKGLNIDDKDMVKIEAIIQSMTPKEREKPDLLDMSRKKRIAKGSGTSINDVNRIIKQFMNTRKMMKKLTKGGKRGKNPFAGFNLPF